MKKINFLIFSIILVLNSDLLAQKENTNESSAKDFISLGGSYLSLSKNKITNNLIGGEFSYSHAISKSTSFGANLLINTKTEDESSSSGYIEKTKIISIQPEFRNYFNQPAFKGVYLAFNAEYQNVKTDIEKRGQSVGGASGNNFGGGIGLGFTPSFGKSLAANIKGGVGYCGSFRWNIGIGIAFKI